MSLAATSWPDVAMGAITALPPILWGVLAELKARRLARENAAEKAEHKKTRGEVQALKTRRLSYEDLEVNKEDV